MGLTGALLPLLLGVLSGGALTFLLRRGIGLLERLAIGACLGMALQGLVGLPLAHRFDLTAGSVGAALLLASLPIALLFTSRVRARLAVEVRILRRALGRRPNAALLVGYATLAALVFAFFHGACYLEGGYLKTDNPANLGDLPYHVAIVRSFTDGANFPPAHPEFHGARLTYPFLSDFVAAQYVRLGASIPTAFLVQNLTLVAALLYLLHLFVRRLTGSATVAHAALPLLLFSGGWGFLMFFDDAAHGGLKETLLHLPRNYSIDAPGLRFGTLFNVLLGTQRSIVLGMPIGIAVWNLWLRLDAQRRGGRARSWGGWALAGLLAGTLPLGHIHTFLVSMLLGGLFALRNRRWLSWLVFYTAAGVVAIPQLIFMLTGSATQTGQFAGFHPFWHTDLIPGEIKGVGPFVGYLREKGGLASLMIVAEWIKFWFRNTALTLPLTAAAWVIAPRRAREFVGPVLLVGFVFPNLFQLAPWIWDNLKVLIYAHLAAAALIGALLVRLGRRGPLLAGLAIALGLCQTLAGALDVWRTVSRTAVQEIFTPEDAVAGAAIRDATPTTARILTAPHFTHPVFLSGRRVFSGYGGHLWSHGLDYGPREEALKRIYAGQADADELLRKWKIDFIVVGPIERNQPDMPISDAYLAKFPIVVEAGGVVLRAVRR